MKLSDLIERLQEMQEDAGDDVDPNVTITYQPNWPLEITIGNVTFARSEGGEIVVTLAEGRHIGYGSKEAWEENDYQTIKEKNDD